MPSSTTISALLAVFCVSRLLKFWSDKKKVRGIPGLRPPVSPAHPIGALLPTSWLNPGLSWQWFWRNQVYERAGADTISVLPFLFGDPTIYTSSIEVARQVVSTRGQFEKPAETTQIVSLWGPNLFAANGDEWRRHRRILGPAFTVDTYKLVWEEASALFDEMVQCEGWKNKREIVLSPVNEITTKFALNIISRCGFGNDLPWKSASDGEGGMDFGEALTLVSHSSIVRLVTPRWMYKLPIKWLQKVEAAYATLQVFMTSLIKSRKEELFGGNAASENVRHDLFSLMIRASEEEGKLAMSDEELAGNTFLMLFAGHETTARTLDAALGFLALYQDIQEEVFAEVASAFAEDPEFSFDTFTKLPKTQASFLEAARLFPAGLMMIRRTLEDVVLNTGDANIHNGQLALPKGMTVIVDVVGIHHNPRYFPEPEEFRPSRWYDTHENDLSMFSFGSRACIGRRFALTEAVTFLAKLLHKWRVEVILKDGETLEQWRRRIMVATVTMSLGVGNVPIRLVARD